MIQTQASPSQAAQSGLLASRLKSASLVFGLLLLLAGQGLLSATYWLQVPLSTFEPLYPLSCSLVPICDVLFYPNYFPLALVIMLIGMAFVAVGLRQTALRLTADFDEEAPPAASAARFRGRWAAGALLCGILTTLATLLTVYSAVNTEDRYPDPPLLFAAVLLLGATFYCVDRLRQRPFPVPRSEIFALVGYIGFCLALGFVYQLPFLQAWEPRALLVAAAALPVLVLWYSGRISGSAAFWVLLPVAGLAVYTYELSSWRFSFVGDEYGFFDFARTFNLNPEAQPNILSSRGVYEVHPVFASLIHAAFMGLYGVDAYGWRMTGVMMVFFSIPLVFAIARWFGGLRAALFAVIFYAVAHHLLGFVRVGYNKPEALPFFCGALLFLLLAYQKRNLLAMFCCGFAAAFSFYTFSLAIPLLPLPLLGLGLWTLLPASSTSFRTRLARALPLAAVYLITLAVVALPRAVNTIWLDDNSLLTVMYAQRETSNLLLEQILPNVLYTLNANLHFGENSHYVSGAHLDPLTSILMLVGVAGLLAGVPRRRAALYLLFAYLGAVLVIGALVPYPYPSHTRTFLLVIFYALFAGMGARYLWEKAREAQWYPPLVRGITLFVMTSVMLLNLYQVLHFEYLHVQRTSIAMLAREFEEASPNETLYYVSAHPEDGNATMVFNSLGFDLNRWQPVLDPSLEGLRQLEREAAAPYRILFLFDEGWQERMALAQQVWVNREPEIVVDGTGVRHLAVIEVVDTAS